MTHWSTTLARLIAQSQASIEMDPSLRAIALCDSEARDRVVCPSNVRGMDMKMGGDPVGRREVALALEGEQYVNQEVNGARGEQRLQERESELARRSGIYGVMDEE